MRTMKPDDCTKYIKMSPQQIRISLQNGKLDWGVANNFTGKRWTYTIFPNKFFGYLGMEVPEEWK